MLIPRRLAAGAIRHLLHQGLVTACLPLQRHITAQVSCRILNGHRRVTGRKLE
jgi:hypothetical protein